MPLDPQVVSLLAELERAGPPLETLSPAAAREQMELASARLGPYVDLPQVDDLLAEEGAVRVPVRVYRPSDEANLPAVLYYHGGGWVIGSVNSHDRFCRGLAQATGMVLVSVDYRRAPEDKFPAAFDDAYAAAVWLHRTAERLGVDPRRLSVAGDSAGGNLAAGVALAARDRGGPPVCFQALIYPITNNDFSTSSYRDFASGYMLTRAGMQWFFDQYLAHPADADSPYCCPLKAESLADLPPALVITAEYDPLRDEGEAYARRLADAGVPVTLSRYDGLIHGFIRRTEQLDQARAAQAQLVAALRAAAAV